jgi:hypothetical protein
MMSNLYRGLMDIVINHNWKIEEDLMKHIRKNCDEITPSQMGFQGFWNFLLEITMLLFTRTIFVTGILLITLLSILFFPLYAISKALTNIKQEHQILEEMSKEEPKIEPKMDKVSK